MKSNPLISRFDLIASEPGDIRYLRKLVIHLAISGRLSSEKFSVREQLKEISSKKHSLIKAGKARKQRALSPISESELPAGCQNVDQFERLENIAILEKGLTAIQSATPGDYPLVVTAEGRSTCDHYDFDGCAAIIPMVSSSGHGNASLKRLHYQEGKFALGNILCAAFPISAELISARFIFEYLTAFKEELLVSRMIGTANVSLTLGKIGEVPVPLLSPIDQRQIDELMALCDRLEAAQCERESRRSQLAAAANYQLNDRANSEIRRKNASFYVEHLPELTERPDQIGTLRQTIVNLAVRGKLTSPNTGTPSEAMCSDIAQREPKPYEIHSSWRWMRMDEIVKFTGGSQPPKSTFIYEPREGYTRLVQIRDFKTDAHRTFVPSERATRPFKEDDVMIGRYGPPVFQILRGLSGTYNVALMKASPTSTAISNDFLFLLLQESRIHDVVVEESERTAGQTGIRLPLLNSFIVGLPPLAEQRCIVAKVNELMALCDRLEKQLVEVDVKRRALLEATLHHALNGCAESSVHRGIAVLDTLVAGVAE